jgi:hypothetical protein
MGHVPMGTTERLALCVKDLTAQTAHPHPLVNPVTGRGPLSLCRDM